MASDSPNSGSNTHTRDRSPRGTSHTTSAGGNPPSPIGGFIDGSIDQGGDPAACRLVHVIVARARDLARRWDALADRAEVAP